MALSSQSVEWAGTPGDGIDLTLEYADRSEITVYFNDIRVYASENKWHWVGTTDKRITIDYALGAGTVIKFKRTTDLTRIANKFEDGAQFTADNLDDNFAQLLHIGQEFVENGGGGGGPIGDITASQVGFVPSGIIDATDVQEAIIDLAAAIPPAAVQFPKPNGVAAQIGSSSRFALEDHVHPGGSGGGGDGTPGTSTGLVYAYKRSLSLPLDNPGEVTFNFVVASIVIPSGDALANGWTKTIPAGYDPLYLCVASASSSDTTDTIAANEWATPVVLAQNGTDGANGVNTATVYLYQRSGTNSAPALPTTNLTYQFSPAALTGTLGNWTTTIPAEGLGEFLFVTTATAVSLTATDVIGPSEWATARLMARNGLQGPPGPGGSGSPGQRGSITVYQSGYSSWSDSGATAAIQAAGLGGPYNRDIVTLYGSGFSQTRFYDYGSWIILTAVIDGNLLVTGTVSASKVSGGILSGVSINIGTGGTPSGKAFEVNNVGVCWVDRIAGNTITAQASTGGAAIRGDSFSGNPAAGVEGSVAAGNSNGNAAGVRGYSSYSGTSGLVGPNGSFDFYANGSGTNYGPFTGAHDALVEMQYNVAVGDILVDKFCVSYGVGVSNTIFATAPSNVPNQPAAIGVAAVPLRTLSVTNAPAAFTLGYDSNWNPIIDPEYPAVVDMYLRTAVNAVGEGMVNVVGEGGNISAGDLIVTSSVSGKGMKQADNIVRSHTVAKARESVTFTGNEVRKVACIYLCG